MNDKDVVGMYDGNTTRARKKIKILLLVTVWIDFEDVMLSRIESGRERQIFYDLTHMWTAENKIINKYKK